MSCLHGDMNDDSFGLCVYFLFLSNPGEIGLPHYNDAYFIFFILGKCYTHECT